MCSSMPNRSVCSSMPNRKQSFISSSLRSSHEGDTPSLLENSSSLWMEGLPEKPEANRGGGYENILLC